MPRNDAFITKQKSFLDFLVNQKTLSPASAAELLPEAESSGKGADELILERNLVNIEDLVKAKAQFLNLLLC